VRILAFFPGRLVIFKGSLGRLLLGLRTPGRKHDILSFPSEKVEPKMDTHTDEHPQPNLKILIRNFVIELVIYGALVIGYFLIALRYLNNFLTNLFQSNLVAYAFLALLLIVAQGVFLDALTSFLLNRIKLDRLE
jgi:hypothetical protein